MDSRSLYNQTNVILFLFLSNILDSIFEKNYIFDGFTIIQSGIIICMSLERTCRLLQKLGDIFKNYIYFKCCFQSCLFTVTWMRPRTLPRSLHCLVVLSSTQLTLVGKKTAQIAYTTHMHKFT